MTTMHKTALLGALGRTTVRAAANAPGTTALTVGLPLLSAGHSNPAAKQQVALAAKKTRYLAARAGGIMKTSGIGYHPEALRRAAALASSIEKHAAAAPHLDDLRRALRSAQYADAGHFDDVVSSVGRIMSKAEEAAAAAARAEGPRPRGTATGLLEADSKKFLGLGAMLGLGAAGIGALTSGASYLTGKGTEAYQAATRNRRYSKMLSADPELAQHPMTRQYFGIVDRMSPYIAGEPLIAAATVRSMQEAPEGYATHPKFVQDLLKVEEARQRTRFPALRAPTFRAELPDMG